MDAPKDIKPVLPQSRTQIYQKQKSGNGGPPVVIPSTESQNAQNTQPYSPRTEQASSPEPSQKIEKVTTVINVMNKQEAARAKPASQEPSTMEEREPQVHGNVQLFNSTTNHGDSVQTNDYTVGPSMHGSPAQQRPFSKGYGAGLDFLSQHIAITGHHGRSKSNFVSQARPYGMQGTRNSGGVYGGVVRMRKNIYDTSKQIARYKNLNKSGTLAHRLNRALPANTNFPEADLREKVSSSGFETSIRFKVSNAMNSESLMSNR